MELQTLDSCVMSVYNVRAERENHEAERFNKTI